MPARDTRRHIVRYHEMQALRHARYCPEQSDARVTQAYSAAGVSELSVVGSDTVSASSFGAFARARGRGLRAAFGGASTLASGVSTNVTGASASITSG